MKTKIKFIIILWVLSGWLGVFIIAKPLKRGLTVNKAIGVMPISGVFGPGILLLAGCLYFIENTHFDGCLIEPCQKVAEKQ